MNPTHLPMAVWIHSSVRSFLSPTVRLKLSPVVPFTDDKEMSDHTELWACIIHKLASPLQFLAHLISLFPRPGLSCPYSFKLEMVKAWEQGYLKKYVCYVMW